MKNIKLISALLIVVVTMPIWYYLLYQILVRVQASELMFFLYWIYLPVGLLSTVLSKIAEDD
jgi:hypothetical protein